MSDKKRASAPDNKMLTDRLNEFDSAFAQARATDLRKRETTLAATKTASGWAAYGGNEAYAQRLNRRESDLTREIAFASSPELDETITSLRATVQPIPSDMSRVLGVIAGDVPAGLMVVLRKSDGAMLASAAPNAVGQYQIDTPCTGKEALVEVHDAAGQLLLQDGAPITLEGGAAIIRNFTITRCGDVTGGDDDNGQTETILMPDLFDQTVKTAQARMAEIGSFKITLEEVFDEKPKDIVIGQSPKPGEPLQPNDAVRIVVSKGPQPAEQMPNVTTKPIADARNILTDYPYRELAIDYVDAPNSTGAVVKQDPEPDSPLGPDTKILLCVGQDQKIMPNVLGIPETAARATIIPKFSTEIEVAHVPSQEANGLVTSQFPSEGAVVTTDTQIKLEINQQISPDRDLRMPDLKGSPEPNGRKELRALGEFVIETKLAPNALQKGMIFAHDPATGAVLDAGQTVVIHVSTGPTDRVAMPKLIGLSQAQAKEVVEGRFGSKLAIKQVASDAEPGSIVAQSPAAGADMTPGQEVTVEVAQAKRRRGTLKMPDLTAMTPTKAKKALREVKITKVDYDKTAARRRNWGVVAQNPPKGAAISGDETVILTFGLRD